MWRSALLVFIPLGGALAANSGAPSQPAPGAVARQVRMRQVIGLAEALELTEADALRMSQIIQSFQQRRRPLQEQVSEAAKIVKRAADGDSSAVAQVDTALNQMFMARTQIIQLNQELFNTLGQGLTPQQRAKMAIYFAKFQVEVRDFQARQRARKQAAAQAAQALNEGDVELLEQQ